MCQVSHCRVTNSCVTHIRHNYDCKVLFFNFCTHLTKPGHLGKRVPFYTQPTDTKQEVEASTQPLLSGELVTCPDGVYIEISFKHNEIVLSN